MVEVGCDNPEEGNGVGAEVAVGSQEAQVEHAVFVHEPVEEIAASDVVVLDVEGL